MGQNNESGIPEDSYCGNRCEPIIGEGGTPNLSRSAAAVASKSRVWVEL